jgi:hypothetical protein
VLTRVLLLALDVAEGRKGAGSGEGTVVIIETAKSNSEFWGAMRAVYNW